MTVFTKTIYVGLIFLSTRTISTTLNDIPIMLLRLFAEISGHFWQPAEFKNLAIPDFKNLKHLQNFGHLLLTAPSISLLCFHNSVNLEMEAHKLYF